MAKKANTVSREFKTSESVLLDVAKTVINNLLKCLDDFSIDYSYMNEDWAKAFLAEVKSAERFIGVKSTREQHEETEHVKELCKNVKDAASTIRSQIEQGYRKEKERMEELLTHLGFNKYWTKVKKRGQRATINLLFTFNNQLNEKPGLRSDLIDHHVSERCLNLMATYTELLPNAQVWQETLKSGAPLITAEANRELNRIYRQTMEICAAGKIVFKGDHLKMSMFYFSKIENGMKEHRKHKPADHSNYDEPSKDDLE